MSSDQLQLPYAEPIGAPPSAYTLPRDHRIWVNRSLKMEPIQWVGFDMDYTLAIYKQTEIDRLSVQATVAKLLERGYPKELAQVDFAYEFPVRGLLIDKRFGHILKMDRYKFVGRAFHGVRELTRDERRALYHARKIRPLPPRYHWIDTLYALPEAALYAGAVDLLDRFGGAVDYGKLFDDIRQCIDLAHQDGAIIGPISRDLPRFISRDRDLAPTLHKLRSAGKKLFVLTNSGWNYTDAMMKYLLENTMPEYPSWRNFFDLVITASKKPAFFQERRPFLERVGDQSVPATSLERGRIYEGGNLRDFERWLGVQGDAVLYVGDHIFGDILRSKKDTAWRTAMIVQEMETETIALEQTREQIDTLDALARQRDRLEDELRFRQTRLKMIMRALGERASGGRAGTVTSPGLGTSGTLLGDAEDAGDDRALEAAPESPAVEVVVGRDAVHAWSAQVDPIAMATTPAEVQRLEHERRNEKKSIERIRLALKELDAQTRSTSRAVDRTFHPYWGSIFKQGVELSSFGDQVEEYACLYTSRVSNFLAYSPLHYYRSPRDFMPHEVP